MKRRKAIGAVLIGLLVLVLTSASAAAAPFVNGTFPLASPLDEANKLTEGPDGNIWVTVQSATKDVARIAPKTGTVEEFDLENVKGPLGIVAAEGSLWVTLEGAIAKFAPGAQLDPGTPIATTVTPIGTIGTVHSVVTGPDGNLWVATNNKVVRIPPKNPAGFQTFDAPGGLTPRDIDVAGQDLVVADGNGAAHRFLTVTTAGAFVEHSVKSAVRGVAGSPSGQIAFSQPGIDPAELGLFTPPSLSVFMKAPGADPSGVALGSDGAFWAVEAFGAESAVRFGDGGPPTPLTPGFPKDSHPRQISAGPEKTLWVTLPGAGGKPGTIGRISGVEALPKTEATEPRTKLGKGPGATVRTRGRRATVRFKFSSPDAGASFECRLARIAKGAKVPAFAACKSAQAYRLRVGRYRFEVRAVLKGVTDKTPASRSVRVVHVGRHRHR